MKWILICLKGTSDTGIIYRKDGNGNETIRYVDSDHVSDLDECGSSARYVFTLVSGAVSWKAFLQNHVALSLTNANYMALTFIAKKVIWLKGLLSKFRVE